MNPSSTLEPKNFCFLSFVPAFSFHYESKALDKVNCDRVKFSNVHNCIEKHRPGIAVATPGVENEKERKRKKKPFHFAYFP